MGGEDAIRQETEGKGEYGNPGARGEEERGGTEPKLKVRVVLYPMVGKVHAQSYHFLPTHAQVSVQVN